MVKKTKYMVFTAKGRHLHHEVVTFGGTKIERIGRDCNTKSFKFLGHWIDDSLNWNDHFQKLASKLNSSNYALAKIKKFCHIMLGNQYT